MLRRFTVAVGRFQVGQTEDYPRFTWDQLAQNVGKKRMEDISKAVIEDRPTRAAQYRKKTPH